MLAKTSTIACVVLGVLFAGRVHAQPDPDSEAKPTEAGPAAGADGADQLTLPKGRALLDAYIAASLSSDAVFKPFSISPDIWYGATDDITVGLVHSYLGTTGFIGGAGQSLCLSGTGGGCSDVYKNVGLDARYKLKVGSLAAAAGGGLYITHITDPFGLAVKLGGAVRWHQGKLAVEVDPNLFFGLTNRDAGNGDVFDLPATVFYAVTPMISAAVQTGFQIPFQNTGDLYAIPLSIGAHYRVNESLNVSLAFSLPRLIGGSLGGNGFDVRSLTLGGTYAF
jgi:hypothetical protein